MEWERREEERSGEPRQDSFGFAGCWNSGRANLIEAVFIACDMLHDFCIERITTFVVYMYKHMRSFQFRRNQQAFSLAVLSLDYVQFKPE